MPGMLEEKDAIREVLAEYCFRLDSGWYDGMAALFAENGTWETAFGKATGREAIAALAGEISAGAVAPRPRRSEFFPNKLVAFPAEAVSDFLSNWTVVQDSRDGPIFGSR